MFTDLRVGRKSRGCKVFVEEILRFLKKERGRLREGKV